MTTIKTSGEVRAHCEIIKLSKDSSAQERDLAQMVILLTNQIVKLQYKLAALEGPPIPPNTETFLA